MREQNSTKAKPQSTRAWFVPVVGITAYACMLTHLAWIGGDPYSNNDEPRHLVTGAFICDLLRELPYDDPVGFAQQYYIQYPSVGVLLFPPLFHFLEGLVFLVVGVGSGAVKWLMTAFVAALLVGWWFWLRSRTDAVVATWSVLLVGLVHDVFDLSGHAMLEVPTLAWMTLAVWCFDVFLRTERSRWCLLAAACASGAALTRFHGPIVLAPLLVQFLEAGKWRLLRRPVLWASGVAGIAAVLPFMWIGTFTARSWTAYTTYQGFPDLRFLGRQIVESVGTAPGILSLVGLAGIVLLPVLRRHGYGVLVAWVAATVLTFLAMAYRTERYLIYAWPPLVTLGVITLFAAVGRGRLRPLAHVALIAVAVGSVWELGSTYRPALGGFDSAAAAAVHASRTKRVFIHARQDGAFIWNVRLLDPDLEYSVFRASKTLAIGRGDHFSADAHVLESDEAILARLDALGVDVVVSADNPELDSPPFHRLMRLLSTDRFEVLDRVAIRHGEGRIRDRELTVYRYRRRQPATDTIVLPLPTWRPDCELRADLSLSLRGWRQRRDARAM